MKENNKSNRKQRQIRKPRVVANQQIDTTGVSLWPYLIKFLMFIALIICCCCVPTADKGFWVGAWVWTTLGLTFALIFTSPLFRFLLAIPFGLWLGVKALDAVENVGKKHKDTQ